MPSTNDFIRFRNAFLPCERVNLVTTTIAWLEKEIKPTVVDVEAYAEFIGELKKVQHQELIPDAWFFAVGKKYCSYQFYDRFLRRFR
jgi:hypothetical protein